MLSISKLYQITGIILDSLNKTTKMANSIPKEFDIKEPINHKTYLIDGIINDWKGDYSEVYSTIFSDKKNIPHKLIGYTPKMD